jgi:hypothetical protein
VWDSSKTAAVNIVGCVNVTNTTISGPIAAAGTMATDPMFANEVAGNLLFRRIGRAPSNAIESRA